MISALVPWFGAKRTQVDAIVSRFGPHQSYLEPFCGSLAVLLGKPRCRMEVVNDLHGGLINLARVVASDQLAPLLFDRLQRTAFCSALYEDSCEAYQQGKPEEGLDPDMAYHYFIVSWMGRNGLAGSASEANNGFCVRNTSGGGDPATRFRNAVSAVPSWWERLRGVTILNEDALLRLTKFEDVDTALTYIDPPYIDEGKEYLHSFAERHAELAEALRRFRKTRVFLSYKDHPLLDELYVRHGWVKEYMLARKHMGGGERGTAEEALLCNRSG